MSSEHRCSLRSINNNARQEVDMLGKKAILFTVLMGLSIFVSGFGAAENLLTNPGFEEGTSGWRQAKISAAGLEMVCETSVAHSEDRSIAIKNTHVYDQPTYNNWRQNIEGSILGDLEGQIVNLSVFMKTEGAEDAHCVLVCYNDDGEMLTVDGTTHVTGTTDWTVHNTGLVVPEGTTKVVVMLGLLGTGKVWFDDVSLTVGDVVVKDEETPTTTTQTRAECEQESLGGIYGLGRLQEPTAPMAEKEWTVLFYDDADFCGFNAGVAFVEDAYSRENINVLVLEDLLDGPANTWYIPEFDWPIRVAHNGEVNMAGYETLRDFVAFAKRWYPAKRYMFFFYAHGSAWRGACYDTTTDPQENDWLTPDEMKQALSETGGVDIVCFSAPCLMGAIEPAYELRDCVDVYIGSEEGSGYVYWIDIINPLCSLLSERHTLENGEIGDEIIGLIRDNYVDPDFLRRYGERNSGMTMSAVRPGRLTALAEAVDAFAEGLNVKLEDDAAEIAAAFEATQFFGWGYTIDLYDFADRCSTFPEVSDAAQDVMQKLKAAVIAEYHDGEHPDAHGLTIYFPDPGSVRGEKYDEIYEDSGLDFVEDTYWDEFLEAYFGSRD